MNKAMKYIAAALIFAVMLVMFALPVFAEDDAEIPDAVSTTETETSISTGETGENGTSITDLWNKFWNAIISLINGTNARDAVVTVCSVLGAVVMLFAKSLGRKLVNKMTGFTAANGAKVNELVDELNKSNENIAELEAKLEGRIGEIYDKCVVAAEKTSEKDARVELTNDAVLALAGMLNTIYTSSTTIPDAAKEIIREKYAGVLHAVNRLNEDSSAGERITETSDIVKAE